MAAWPPVVRRAFRVAHAVRARLAEDVAAAGLAAGGRDYVLLGAGLDTFAWRHPRAGDFVVWEIDHPDPGMEARGAAAGRAGPSRPASGSWPRTCRRSRSGTSGSRPGDLELARRHHVPATRGDRGCAAGDRRGTRRDHARRQLPAARSHARRAGTRRARLRCGGGRGHRGACRATYTRDQAADLLGEAGFSGIELFDASWLRDRYLRDRPDLPLPGTTLIAVATVQR